MPSSTTSNSFLRQLSGKEAWKSTSSRWSSSSTTNYQNRHGDNAQWKQHMEGLNGHNTTNNSNSMMYGDQNMVMMKRVMVVVDESSHSKHAMMWALTHVANKGDRLTLLHVVPPNSSAINGGSSGGGGNRANGYSESSPDSSSSPYLATSLGSLCKACKPEVEVEALWIQGPKLATVMSQVKKLDVSVLVLGHKKSYSLLSCLYGRSSTEKFVDECIINVECLTIGVRKQSQGIGGYLISTRWQKDFWLLA